MRCFERAHFFFVLLGVRLIAAGCEDGLESCAKGAAQEQLLLQIGAEKAYHASFRKAKANTSSSGISIDGRRLLIDGQAFHMKGINWNPIAKGKTGTEDEDRLDGYVQFVQQDGDLMADAGINVIRTYGPLTDHAVLDALWQRGIYVMNTVYGYGLDDPENAIPVVEATKNHPAILMWVIGNEWNYNGLYAHIGHDVSLQKIQRVAALIKGVDTTHPISTIYGGLPSHSTLESLGDIDIWGLNVYSGISFGNIFGDWQARSEKPMYFGEYGADAFNAITNSEDQAAQADATTQLTNEIIAQSSATTGGVCIGGLLFELADEWWKDGSGSRWAQDNHGIAPGGGPHPDSTFNEEWWGIVDIDRRPRLAFDAYKEIGNPVGLSS